MSIDSLWIFIWTQHLSHYKSMPPLKSSFLRCGCIINAFTLLAKMLLQTTSAPCLYKLMLSFLSPRVPCNKMVRFVRGPDELGDDAWYSRISFLARDCLFCFPCVKSTCIYRGIRLMTWGLLVTVSLSWPSLILLQLLLLESSTHLERNRSHPTVSAV